MNIIERLAAIHREDPQIIRQEIQTAINLAWVDREGEPPDPETLISILSRIVANR